MRTIEERMKDDFVSNMTHNELKTPIAIAYSANDALLNYMTQANDPRQKKTTYLTIANKQLKTTWRTGREHPRNEHGTKKNDEAQIRDNPFAAICGGDSRRPAA